MVTQQLHEVEGNLTNEGTSGYKDTRIARPHATPSCTKSSPHSWLGAVATSNGWPTRKQCFRRFRRSASPASR